MILLREDLIRAIVDERLIVRPLDLQGSTEDQRRIQTGSIDLRVGESYARFADDPGLVNMRLPRRLTQIDGSAYRLSRLAEMETFIIAPMEFCLLAVDLHIELPNDICAYVEGKSSVGRAGLLVVNAGFVEAGFKGILTLELFNCAPFPIEIAGGDDIAQLVLVRGSCATAYPYGAPGLGNRYQGQGQVQPPRNRPGPYENADWAASMAGIR